MRTLEPSINSNDESAGKQVSTPPVQVYPQLFNAPPDRTQKVLNVLRKSVEHWSEDVEQYWLEFPETETLIVYELQKHDNPWALKAWQ